MTDEKRQHERAVADDGTIVPSVRTSCEQAQSGSEIVYVKPDLRELAKETLSWVDGIADTSCEYGTSIEYELHQFMDACGQYKNTIWPDMMGVKDEKDKPLRDFLVQANDLLGKIFFDAHRLCTLCRRCLNDGVERVQLYESEYNRLQRINVDWENEQLFGEMEGCPHFVRTDGT